MELFKKPPNDELLGEKDRSGGRTLRNMALNIMVAAVCCGCCWFCDGGGWKGGRSGRVVSTFLLNAKHPQSTTKYEYFLAIPKCN